MGNFIDVAAVLAPPDRVRAALATLGADAGCISIQADRTLVLYSKSTGDFGRVRELSRTLGTAAFACHIHDDDLWLYEFYLAGELTDQFNTCPDYSEELGLEQKATWRGNAELLAQHWPGLSAAAVSRYLRWDEGEDDDDLDEKAYPDDEFAFSDCWQMTDFLRRLGTPYPDAA